MLKSIVVLDQYQKDCIALLEEALEQAQAGNVMSVAVVTVLKQGVAANMAGNRAADLYLGAGKIMSDIQDRLKTQRAILR